MPYKEKESYRKWYQENKEWKRKQVNAYHKVHPEIHQRAWHKYWLKFQKIRDEYFGITCSLCNGKSKRMCLHEIHGKSHSRNPSYILRHLVDFRILCWKCHAMIHRFLNGEIEIEKFLELIKCPMTNPSKRGR